MCSTFSNLLDKRSRFLPSMQSMLATCPLPWLLGPFSRDDSTPRWQRTKLISQAPTKPITLPTRAIRVMYALPTKLYDPFLNSQIPHAHEFFVPVDALLTPESWQEPAIRAFIARTSISANFWAYTIAAE